MTTEQTINRLFLKSLLLAEITRYKFGAGYSLTNPKVEKNARYSFAEIVGIKKTAKPDVFIKAIGSVYADNQQIADFQGTLSRFKLDASLFI